MYRPDDDIDHISREAAEHYNAPGKPDWDALQRTLDRELPIEKEKKRRGFLFFFLAGLGLLVAGSGLWYVAKRQSPQNSVPIVKNTADGGQSPNPQADTIQAKDGVTQQSGKTKITIPTKSNSVAIENNKTTPVAPVVTQHGATASLNTDLPETTNPVSKTNLSGTKAEQENADSRRLKNKGSHHQHIPDQNIVANLGGTVYGKKTLSLKEGRQPLAKFAGKGYSQTKQAVAGKMGSEEAAGTANRTADKNIGNFGPENLTSTGTISDTQLVMGGPTKKLTTTDSTLAEKKKIDTVSTAATAQKKHLKKQTGFMIGLTGGTDISTIKYRYGASPGYNIGITGGYQFSPKWSVYTGIVYTQKNYKLRGQDYNPPKHYWTQYVQLETVAGYCKMWEIPLQARFTFNPSAKNAFFAAAGLSSYFMTLQKYNYNYKSASGAPMSMAWTNDSTYSHVMSILDLSVGVQKQLGNHLNWQVEPYARIPLGGVGFGNIRLSSFGVNLTVQYKRLNKR